MELPHRYDVSRDYAKRQPMAPGSEEARSEGSASVRRRSKKKGSDLGRPQAGVRAGLQRVGVMCGTVADH